MLLQGSGDLISRLEKLATQINASLVDEADKVTRCLTPLKTSLLSSDKFAF